jgi:hypothetical protein
MTYLEFNTRRLETQADIVCQDGVFLGERETLFFEISLFQVEGFYVEVFYHKLYKTTLFEGFENTGLLYPYLKEISLAGLF